MSADGIRNISIGVSDRRLVRKVGEFCWHKVGGIKSECVDGMRSGHVGGIGSVRIGWIRSGRVGGIRSMIIG